MLANSTDPIRAFPAFILICFSVWGSMYRFDKPKSIKCTLKYESPTPISMFSSFKSRCKIVSEWMNSSIEISVTKSHQLVCDHDHGLQGKLPFAQFFIVGQTFSQKIHHETVVVAFLAAPVGNGQAS